MSETADSPPAVASAAPAAGTSITEGIGKWVAVLASVIGVAQAGSAWIEGHWRAEAEARRGERELKLADLQAKSGLAKDFLQLIIGKDTAPAERVRVLDALRSIDGHPLQAWAKQSYEIYNANLADLMAAYEQERQAAEQREGAGHDEAALQAEIAALNSRIKAEQDNPPVRDDLQKQLVARSAALGQVRARLAVATFSVTETRSVITRSEQGIVAVPGREPAAHSLVTISQKIDAPFLARYFPADARANIETAAPAFQAALQEFQVSDRRMVAAIIATVAVETPRFEAYEEPESAGAHYEGRRDLGNVNPGDGVRFRGRGYLGMTGRQNYETMSARLGLGSRLIDAPGDARSPEVASRTLVAWFVDRSATLQPALDANNLGAIRRAVNGSPTNQIARFTEVFQHVLTDL